MNFSDEIGKLTVGELVELIMMATIELQSRYLSK